MSLSLNTSLGHALKSSLEIQGCQITIIPKKFIGCHLNCYWTLVPLQVNVHPKGMCGHLQLLCGNCFLMVNFPPWIQSLLKNRYGIVWKFQDFCITEILREINFEDSRSAKFAFFAILGAVNFVHLVNSSLQKVQKFIKIKIQSL